MTKIQKIIALASAAVLMLGLSACSTDGRQFSPGATIEFTANLDDGTEVPCIKVDGLYGIDCNWDKAVRSNTPKP